MIHPRNAAWLVALALTACGGASTPTTIAPEPPPLYTESERDASDAEIEERMEAYHATYAEALTEAQAAQLSSCEASECARIGDSLGASSGLDGHEAREELMFWFKACAEGVGASCTKVAQAYQDVEIGIHGEDEPPLKLDETSEEALGAAFLSLMTRACVLDAAQCEHWADHYLGAERVNARRLLQARDVLEAACEAKQAGSCRSLAYHHQEGNHVDKDLALARSYQGKACEASQPRGKLCQAYALMLYRGEGGPTDSQTALNYFEAACTPRNPAWTTHCEGDPATGEEVCRSGFVDEVVEGCLALVKGERVTGDEARRRLSAMCNTSLLKGEAALEACRQAEVMWARSNDEARQRVGARLCDAQATACMLGGGGLEGCPEQEEACRSERGLPTDD